MNSHGARKSPFPRALLLILGLSLLLNATGIGWGLPSWSGWAMDEIIPSEVLAGMEQYFSNGWHSKYPPLHYYTLGIFYLPLLFVRSSTFSAGGSDLTLYTMLFFVGRWISVMMATAIVYLVFRIGSELCERRAALFAAGITALGGPFVYYAKTVNVDVPYIFWFSMSLLFFVRSMKRHALADYVLFALTAVCAICTKDQAYGFYVLAPVPLAWSAYVHSKAQAPGVTFSRVLFDRKNIIALGVGMLLFVLLHNWPFNFSGFMLHMQTIVGKSSRGYQIYPRTLAGHWDMFVQAITHLRFVLGWPAFIVCLLGLVRELLRTKKDFLLLSLLTLVLSYYLAFIGVVMYHYERFMIPVALVFSFFGGRLLSEVFAKKFGPQLAKKIILLLMIGFSLWNAASVDASMLADSRYKVERWMKRNIRPENSVGFIGFVQSLPRSWAIEQRHFFYGPQALQIGKIKPDYLIINPDSTIGDPTFDEKPGLENLGYVLVLQYRTPLKWASFSPDTFFRSGRKMLYSNLDKINPEIKIYWHDSKKQGPGLPFLMRP